MPDGTSSAFHRKLAEKRAKEAAEKAAAAPAPTHDYSDLIPEDTYERSDADRGLDEAVAGIDILAAYGRWCGKMSPKVGNGQRENIMISCPTPTHGDKNPSAAINLDKQVWSCYGCGEGGDAHDIAAHHYGYPVPAYKTNGDFHKLRIKMAEDFGYRFERTADGTPYVMAPELETPAAPVATTPTVAAPEPGSAADEFETFRAEAPIELFDDGDLPQYVYPALDWRSIIPPDSFVGVYMKQACLDDVAEEYHLFNALVAVGFALGRRARLDDLLPVHGNLFVCTLGHSGTGKSKALGHFKRLMASAMPHDWSDPESRGMRTISSPGSAEVMVHHFQKAITDPSTPTKVLGLAPVSGLIDFNELSQLMSRANRTGSAMKPTLMQFYDMDSTISTSSLTTGAKEAFEPFASAITTTQPAAFRTLVSKTDDDSGFLNRWVFVAGPEKQKIAIGGARIDMEPAVEPLRRILGWSGTFGDDDYIDWGPEAHDMFTDFFHKELIPKKKAGGSALLSRIDLTMKKIILLLAGNKRERIVSGKTVEQAIAMYPYLLECYDMPEEELGKTLATDVEDAVLYQIKKHSDKEGKGMTMSQISRNLARRKYPKDLLLRTIEQLVKLEQIEVQTTTPGGIGRPTTRYKYAN